MQDNSVTLKFRTSQMERFADPSNDQNPNGFENYTGDAIRNALRDLSKPAVEGLYRWFANVTQTLSEQVDLV